MEDVATSTGGHPSKRDPLLTPSTTAASIAVSPQTPSSQSSHGSTNHRRRYTGSSIPLRPDAPLPPVLSNGFVPISAPSIIASGGFDTVDRFRSNLGYPAYNNTVSGTTNQRQGRTQQGLRHSSPHNHQRRQSRSSDRDVFQQEMTGYSTATWSGGNPTRMNAASSLGPRHSIANFQSNLKTESLASVSTRPQYRTQRTSHTLSNSMPSTPRHPRTRQDAGKSRSPSPPTFTLDSPRSATSESSAHPTQKARCLYESGLVLQRRRIPYSLGSEALPDEKPPRDSLSTEDDATLTADMEKLYNELLPSDESNERRRKFLIKLERLLNDEWPGHEIKVHPFGSTENKLCSTDSDVDVCIVTTFKEIENVCSLARALAKHRMERIICVQNAKVPIVRIWDPEYKVQCDMNVNNTLALENTRMVKTYVDIDPRVRPLAMIIKQWTKQRILNDAAGGGTLSSYTWICMIINFLQTRSPPILPSLHQREHKKLPPINGVDVSFDDDIEKLRGFGEPNTESLGALLFGFFKRYGHEIDFEKKAVSVRMGTLISKEEKGWHTLFGNRLCVEEPFSTSRNLSNGADDNAVKGLHLEFRRAFKLLCESPPNFVGWQEEYIFPKEEQISSDFVKPASRPVQMTRSNSANKGRAGESSGRARNRQFGGYHAPRQQGQQQFNNRRASSGSQFAGVPLTTHLLQPDSYYLVQNTDGTFQYVPLSALQKPLLDAQHAHRQAQLTRQSVLNSLTQAASQQSSGLQGQQPQSSQDAAKQQAQQMQNTLLAQTSLQALNLGYPYLVPYPPILYYTPGVADPYNTNLVPSPTIPQSSLEQRLNRAKGLHPGGPRSRSQPAPHLDPGARQIPTLVHPESQLEGHDMLSESIATASSTSEQPQTPCESGEDMFDEYYGYMYPESQLPMGQSQDSFVSQKDVVDHQRRLSKEQLVTPKFSDHRRPSQPPSPIMTSNHSRFNQNQESIWSSSDGDGERSISQDSFDEEPRQRGPVIVNGSASSVPVTPPFDNDSSPQLSVRGDSPREGSMFPSATGFTDSYTGLLLEQAQAHAGYGQHTTLDDLTGMSKTAYSLNPYTGQPIPYTAYPQFTAGYPMIPQTGYEAHHGQKQRHRQTNYGRQYDVEQALNASRYANQVQPHLDLATPTHGLSGREAKSSQPATQPVVAAPPAPEPAVQPKQSGKGSPQKHGGGRKGQASKVTASETENSSEDGTHTAKGSGQAGPSNKNGGTIRASGKAIEAIQAAVKSANSSNAGPSSQGAKGTTKADDGPGTSQGHSHTKSKEWNVNTKRKSNNKKKKKSSNAEPLPAAGEERKGG